MKKMFYCIYDSYISLSLPPSIFLSFSLFLLLSFFSSKIIIHPFIKIKWLYAYRLCSPEKINAFNFIRTWEICSLKWLPTLYGSEIGAFIVFVSLHFWFCKKCSFLLWKSIKNYLQSYTLYIGTVHHTTVGLIWNVTQRKIHGNFTSRYLRYWVGQ